MAQSRELAGKSLVTLLQPPRSFHHAYVRNALLAFIDPPAMMNKGVKTSTSDSWDDLSPRLVADYHFSENLMGFVSAAKGYKAGGFNSVQINSRFDNEDV